MKNAKNKAKRFSHRLPEGFQSRNLGSCVYACYLLTEYNYKRGFTDFSVVNGRVSFTDYDGNEHTCVHNWILLRNGKIYDPTYNQFSQYPINEQPRTDIYYLWKDYEVETPQHIIEEGCDITPEFKAWHYKKTKVGEYFIGAMWESEVKNPELIPIKFRAQNK